MRPAYEHARPTRRAGAAALSGRAASTHGSTGRSNPHVDLVLVSASVKWPGRLIAQGLPRGAPGRTQANPAGRTPRQAVAPAGWVALPPTRSAGRINAP
jgi:hypothetical protein